jgi:archaellum component FlaC
MRPIRQTQRGRGWWIGSTVGIAVLLLILAACGSAGSSGAPADQAYSGGNEQKPPAVPDQREEGGQPSSAPFADLAERKIVKTGEITLQVDNIGTAVGEVRAMAVALGGYVGGSNAGADDERATLTLRIPADRFEEALGRVRDMDGDVRAEATSEQDVTSSIVDLEARIDNLEASEAQYRLLVERAQKVRDILSVQSRLDDVRGQIEQLKAQLEQLSGLAALSTLTVTLAPASTPVEDASEGWDPGATFDEALAALVGVGQGTSDLLIWLAIVALPIALMGGVVLVLAWRLTPAIRRRVPVATPGVEE